MSKCQTLGFVVACILNVWEGTTTVAQIGGGVDRGPAKITYQFSDIPSAGRGPNGRVGVGQAVTHDLIVTVPELDETHSIQPPPPLETITEHMQVFTSGDATTFWAKVFSPSANFVPSAGENVGGSAFMMIERMFVKESEDAFLHYDITEMILLANAIPDHPTEPDEDNVGLFGSVNFKLNAYKRFPGADVNVDDNFDDDLQEFWTRWELSGHPNQYAYKQSILAAGPELLDVGVTDGGLDEASVAVSLLTPKRIDIDLSKIEVGEEFRTTYILDVTAYDTIQFDSRIDVFGRDPLGTGSGTTLSFGGLTPVDYTVERPSGPTILSPTAVLGTDLGSFGIEGFENSPLENLVNQSGLDKPFVSGETSFAEYFSGATGPRADQHFSNEWQSDNESDPPITGYIDFDLGDTYLVDQMAIWNVSLEDIKVLYSTEDGGEFQSVGSFTLTDNTETLSSYAHDLIEFESELEARYMRIEVESNYPFFARDGFRTDFAVVGEIAFSVTGLTSSRLSDFSDNGILDAADIDLLTSEINSGLNNLDFDLNDDGSVDGGDRIVWVEELANTFFGDANFDLVFDSNDFVSVFQAGEYEDGVELNSTWADGDWNGNREFDSGDFVLAFQRGGYESGPRTATVAVPEPSFVSWLQCAVFSVFWLTRRRR